MSGSTASKSPSHTLVITLSSVFSVVGALLLVSGALLCCRYRRRHGHSLFPRGISPIDDDEIEAWKAGHETKGSSSSSKVVKGTGSRAPGRGGIFSEKGPEKDDGDEAGDSSGPESPALDAGIAAGEFWKETRGGSREHISFPPRTLTTTLTATPVTPLSPPPRARGSSLDSATTKKPPSNVIVYHDPLPLPPPAFAPFASIEPAASAHSQRRSEDLSPRPARSLSIGRVAGRFSLDQDHRPRTNRNSVATISYSYSPTGGLPAIAHARAPNARAGLTDESIPGDPSFLPPPKRQPSSPRRLQQHYAHHRHRSSHSMSSYWHARTRSGRSMSTVSGQSFGSETPLQAQPPLSPQSPQSPDSPWSPQSSQPPETPQSAQRHARRSSDFLASPGSAGLYHAYLRNPLSRIEASPLPWQHGDADDVDNDGLVFGGLSPPRPRNHSASEIGQAK